jgi:uncharacterized protein YbaA (DUF1428 family)
MYIDGFILPVPTKNLAAYKKMSTKAGKIWREHGAMMYHEAAGDDLEHHKFGTPFPQYIKPKKGETIVFAWIAYKSRKHRDAVNKKVMADKRLMAGNQTMPFDMKRMAYGGFKVFVSA